MSTRLFAFFAAASLVPTLAAAQGGATAPPATPPAGRGAAPAAAPANYPPYTRPVSTFVPSSFVARWYVSTIFA